MNSKSLNAPERHHYVPQVYLRRSATPGDRNKVGIAERHGEVVATDVKSIGSIGYEEAGARQRCPIAAGPPERNRPGVSPDTDQGERAQSVPRTAAFGRSLTFRPMASIGRNVPPPGDRLRQQTLSRRSAAKFRSPAADIALPALGPVIMSALLDCPERLLLGARIGIADVPDGEPACQLRALVPDI